MKIIWSKAEDSQLAQLRKDGVPYREIAEIMGRPRTTLSSRMERISQTALQKSRKKNLKNCICLKCQKPFKSWNTTLNRICDSCKGTDAWRGNHMI